MELKDLQEKAKDRYEGFKKRKRELYKLARSKGFTPAESLILSGTSENNILRLAEEKSPLPPP